MKLKVFSVLCVFVLFFTLVLFTSTNGDGLPDKNQNLANKIENIQTVLRMHHVEKGKTKDKKELKAYFKKLVDANSIEIIQPDGTKLTMHSELVRYWEDLQAIRIDFTDVVISDEIPVTPVSSSQYAIIGKVKVTMNFHIITGTNDTGFMSFNLRHMRRCEWD